MYILMTQLLQVKVQGFKCCYFLYVLGDVFQNSCQRCHWMMHQSRSRRPVSVNDVPVAEAFLFVNPSESFGDDSGVFMKSPCSSSSSSFLGSEQGNGKLLFDTTSTPNASASLPDPKRRLFSWAEGI